MQIIFESHATTFDNEAGRASGWNDDKLSPTGIENAKELGRRRSLDDFDAVYTSDLQRAYQTAVLAFGHNTGKIFQDWRLRECNYGEMTGKDKNVMDIERPRRIKVPFPGGESFEIANLRVVASLIEIRRNQKLKNVMIIGHRSTHYGLETLIAGKTLDQCIRESFGWKWQPGWKYTL